MILSECLCSGRPWFDYEFDIVARTYEVWAVCSCGKETEAIYDTNLKEGKGKARQKWEKIAREEIAPQRLRNIKGIGP